MRTEAEAYDDQEEGEQDMPVEQWTLERLEEYVGTQYDRDDTARYNRMIGRWLARGDGAAVYENAEIGHPQAGTCQIVSFGSDQAVIPGDDPPQTLPDFPGQINWRFQLKATCRTA